MDTFSMTENNWEQENKGAENLMETMETMEVMEETMETTETMEAVDEKLPVDETAVITAAMVIKGDIATEGSIDVIGTVNGNIEALGKLNITGHIIGNSKAAEIYAEGAKVNGEIYSDGAVKIGASSVIIGNITATSNIKSKSVQINNGAVVEGMCSQCYADVSPAAFFDEYKLDPSKTM